MTDQETEERVASTGRSYGREARVRLADADPAGRFRLDGIARLLQDVALDDVRDAGYTERLGWVARKTELRVTKWAEFDEELEALTWCSGASPRWAERRTSITGSRGAAIETVAVWIAINLDTGRPPRVGGLFEEIYGRPTGTVDARLAHPDLPPGEPGLPWSVRRSDLDVYAHVNNAVYWEAVEETLPAQWAAERLPMTVEVEHHHPADLDSDLRLVACTDLREHRMWIADGTKRVASAIVALTQQT